MTLANPLTFWVGKSADEGSWSADLPSFKPGEQSEHNQPSPAEGEGGPPNNISVRVPYLIILPESMQSNKSDSRQQSATSGADYHSVSKYKDSLDKT